MSEAHVSNTEWEGAGAVCEDTVIVRSGNL